MALLNNITTWLSIIFTIIGIVFSFQAGLRVWNMRHIKKVLGIQTGDDVLIVCSELPDPIDRQMVEEREYIYLMKYGDLDAWVENLLSMVKMFPKCNLHISSSGEALQNTMDLEGHIFLIGGPDYNKMTEDFINKGLTRFAYDEIDGEIALHDTKTGKNYFYTTLDKDFGYIEKIPNPYNPKKNVIFFGGCHTIGVTSAVKFLSAFSNGRSNISDIAYANSKMIVQDSNIDINKFVLLINATKVGSTISYPTTDNIVDIENNATNPA